MLYRLTYPSQAHLLGDPDTMTESVQQSVNQQPTSPNISETDESSEGLPSYVQSFLSESYHLDQRIFNELTRQVNRTFREDPKLDRNA